MQDRRTFLSLAAASLLPVALDAQSAASQAAAVPLQPGDLARHALTGPFEGFEAVISEVTVQPDQAGAAARPAHRHSGFVLGYVIEGQLRFAINNEPERVVSAGGTFFEPIGALHSTNGAAAGKPAKFVAFLVVPKGSPVVTRS